MGRSPRNGVRAMRERRKGTAPHAPKLLTAAEFDRVADVVASVAAARLDTPREDVVMAGEVLDGLERLRPLLTDPPAFRVGWRR
jgi:hypothetical protein